VPSVVVLVAAALLAVGLPAGPAQAESAEQARVAARRAAAEVERLRPQLDTALADYEQSLSDLATDVTRGLTADEQAEAARATAAEAQRARVGRLRALYMSGGGAVVFASLLTAQGPSDLLSRLDSVQRVVHADARSARAAAASAATARTLADRQLARAERTAVTVGDVEDVARRLEALLGAAESRLAGLSARARDLEEAERAAAALAAARLAAARAGAGAARSATARGIPPAYLALYRSAAATCPGLDWHVLAAIGQVESGHGRNVGPSSAGAQGPMQFLPSTFAAYAVDGDGDGDRDIWDPADSVFSAARYLCANKAGNPRSLPRAIWHYNHADWYVAMVLRVAEQLRVRYPG
jgi:soluble lytic murein transglycosylase-like protein